MSTTNFDSKNGDELVPVYVPRRYYVATLNFLAGLIARDQQPLPDYGHPVADMKAAVPSTDDEPQRLIHNGWTSEEIAHLRSQLPPESVAITLFDLICREPGKRVTFDDLLQASGKEHNRARAELAALSKKIRGMFGRDRKWPIMWVQEGSNIIYFASSGLAKAWHAAAEL
jgi:hypothetical protein